MVMAKASNVVEVMPTKPKQWPSRRVHELYIRVDGYGVAYTFGLDGSLDGSFVTQTARLLTPLTACLWPDGGSLCGSLDGPYILESILFEVNLHVVCILASWLACLTSLLAIGLHVFVSSLQACCCSMCRIDDM